MYTITPFITPKDPIIAQLNLIVISYTDLYFITVDDSNKIGPKVSVVAYMPNRLWTSCARQLNAVQGPLMVSLYIEKRMAVGRDIVRTHACNHKPSDLVPKLQN